MAVTKARQITPTTIKRLFALSGNQCAFPGCSVKIAQPDNSPLITAICHIEAAEIGGERYNPNQTDNERRSFENLILLCPNHHAVTDDAAVYDVAKMKEMKRSHEKKMLLTFSANGVMAKYPMGLVTVINQISASGIFDEEGPSDESLNSFKIEEKIRYNDIKEHKSVLDEYKVYHGKLNKIYEEIEQGGSFKKERLLKNIRHSYLEARGNLTDGAITSIRANADKLIDEVEKSLWKLIEKSNNLSADVSYEAIELSIQIIMVDAFMRCKILEEPNDNQ